jgi:putative ABC transport system ATP-binding protein
MIRAEDLGKVYRTGRLEVPALRNATFSVEAGEFVAIVGPSGSGKSTLFYLLGGLTRATSGRVFIGGTDFSALGDAERTKMRRARIGFIFQKFNLLPTLSARANIEIAYEIADRSQPMDPAFFTKLTDLLHVTGRLDHRPSELSGGEQQRVAIARAIINEPKILLADEPTGNLDSKNSEVVLQMLRQLNKDLGQTIVMITHNPEATAYFDRVVHMRDGVIVDGVPAD